MKLRTKITLIIVAAWVIMIALFHFNSHRVIMKSYLQLENEMIVRNIDRTISALDIFIDRINSVLKDWSIWDDTYQFIQNKNQGFIRANMVLSSFQSTGLDIMLFYDLDGKLVYALGVDKNRSKTVPVSSKLQKYFSQQHKLIHQPTTTSGTSGVISTPEGVFLFAAHAITSSQGNDPVKGTMVGARRFTSATEQEIVNLVKADADFIMKDEIKKSDAIEQIYQATRIKNNNLIEVTKEQLNGYKVIHDINNQDAMLLEVKLPRSILKTGEKTVTYSILLFIAYSLFITILLWYLLQFLVIKRIERLSQNITRSGNDNKYFAKLAGSTSDEVSAIAELYRQATHDPLTGLTNRNLLHTVFNHYARHLALIDKKIVLILINIDNFKRINDRLGHNIGDMVLKEISERILHQLNENDIASRIGGDEFVVMLTGINNEDTPQSIDNIFKSLCKPITVSEHNIHVTVSMGISTYPDDSTDIMELIKLADISMHHAKESGRNRYEKYSYTLSKAITESHHKELELQIALDKEQLCLFYQPIYDLRTKQIVSFEALIRWNHPERGLIGADQIIPLAEKIDLIKQIGDWVLKTACYQLKEWQDKGLPILPVAVNLSSAEIRLDSICSNIISILEQTNLSSEYLTIEITETGFIELNPKLLTELRGLRANGVSLTIDDFGTGYSGLGYLKSLPVEKLKIDKTFIRDIHTDPDDKAIVLAIIAIAHQLNLRITAEGVETAEQYNFLCYHQVDEVQGNYLSPPLSEDECEKLLSGEPGHTRQPD